MGQVRTIIHLTYNHHKQYQYQINDKWTGYIKYIYILS